MSEIINGINVKLNDILQNDKINNKLMENI